MDWGTEQVGGFFPALLWPGSLVVPTDGMLRVLVNGLVWAGVIGTILLVAVWSERFRRPSR